MRTASHGGRQCPRALRKWKLQMNDGTGAAAERVNFVVGVISIHHIPQNEACKWHVKSVNISVFVCR